MEVTFKNIVGIRLNPIGATAGQTAWTQLVATDKDGKEYEINLFPVPGKSINVQLGGED